MRTRYFTTFDEAAETAIKYGVNLNDFLDENQGKMRAGLWEEDDEEDGTL